MGVNPTLLAAILKAFGNVPAPPAGSSLYFSDNDYAIYTGTLPDIFGGVLLTAWTRNPQPAGYPYSQQNKTPFWINGTDWSIWCITGNMIGTMTQYQAGYNANITLWGAGGDELGFIAEGTPESQSLDWVFNAWQFQFTGTEVTDLVIVRQWVRLGWLSPFIIKETIFTVAEMRTRVDDPAWVPSAATQLIIGATAGGEGGSPQFSMTKVRIYEQSAAPTQAELTALMLLDAPDTSAWADLNSLWVAGAPSIVDQSGNSRNPTIVGAPAQGQNTDNTNVPPIYLRQTTPQVITDSEDGDWTGSLALTFPIAPVVGNHIGVEYNVINATTAAVTDSQSNSYTAYEAASATYLSAFAIAEVATAASTVVTINQSGAVRYFGRAFEYVGIDQTTPVDWSATNLTPANPLTITAPSASTRDHSVGVSVAHAPAGLGGDYTYIMPYGWNGLMGTTIPAHNAGQVRTQLGVATTESVVWPQQSVPATANLVGLMVGLRPAV